MKRFFKWLAILLLVAVAGFAIWGYAPDTDPGAMRAKYATGDSKFIDVGSGLKVHLRDEGPRDAAVLVLLHGSNASLQTWEPWVQRLKPRFRIVSLDQIGHGLTGPNPAGRYDAKGFVDALDATVSKLGLTRFALAGNSMGGWVAWNYALAHPDKLSALILVDAGGAPDSKPTATPIGFKLAQTPGINTLMQVITPRAMIAKSVRQSMSNQAVIDDAMIDRYWELLRYPGNRAATGLRFATPRVPAGAEDMARLRMPTLILWGAHDTLIPLSAGRWFREHIRGAKLIVYPGIGHIPMEEAPDRSAMDVGAFLGALPPATK